MAITAIVLAVCFFPNSRIVEATQRSSNLNELMKGSLTIARRVEIDGKVFGVFINHAEKTVTVRGAVEGWEEKDRVEQYFRLRTPSDYHVNYDLTFGY
ncbi:MAG: hypothetical protein ACMUIL_09870 [bacterium]